MGWFTGGSKPQTSKDEDQEKFHSESNISYKTVTCRDDPQDQRTIICVEEISDSLNKDGKESRTTNKRQFRIPKEQSGLMNPLFSQLAPGLGMGDISRSPQVDSINTGGPPDPFQLLFGPLLGLNLLNDRGMFILPHLQRPQQPKLPQQFNSNRPNQHPYSQPNYQSNYFFRQTKPDEKIYDL